MGIVHFVMIRPIVGGVAKLLNGQPVTVIGNQKGHELTENNRT